MLFVVLAIEVEIENQEMEYNPIYSVLILVQIYYK